MSESDLYVAYVDGACTGNPGPMGIGGVLYRPDGRTLCSISEFKGPGTNNQAEYLALIEMLQAARRYGVVNIEVRTDSELLVRQVYGIYKVKHEGIRPLYERVVGLLRCFESFRVVHVRRELNRVADRLSKIGAARIPAGPA